MSNDKITNQNTIWHPPTVMREHRELLNGHKGAILWFTGLSGAGKSTIAHAVEDRLHKDKIRTYVLDGDNIRRGLCKDLGFTDADRTENIRRIGEVSRLMMQAGVITLTAFISPFRSDRQIARSLVDTGDFIEVYCKAPLEVCEERDPKGLYKKARAGQIPEFTGIDSPYEEPQTPEIVVDTQHQSVDECVQTILDWLKQYRILNS